MEKQRPVESDLNNKENQLGHVSSSSSDEGDEDHHPHGKDHRHGKLHKGKLFIGVGALLLLLLSAVLLACFLRNRKKLQSRNEHIEKLETIAKDKQDTWTTPPDSTVAWLQAKGWHNPVYYALEELPIKTPNVAI